MSFALIGAILLLFATVKVFLWMSARIIRRQQYFECTRKRAGNRTVRQARFEGPVWRNTWRNTLVKQRVEAIDQQPLDVFGPPVDPGALPAGCS